MPILTLLDAKTHLNITSTDDDAELTRHVLAASEIVAEMCGAFDEETVVDTLSGGGYEVTLTRWPVTSVTSVVPVLTGGQTVDAADVDVDESGVARSKSGRCFPAGQYRWTYLAARPDVPEAVTLGAAIIVQHMWETQRGRQARGGFIPGEGTTAIDQSRLILGGFSLPRRALELLGPYTQLAGFA